MEERQKTEISCLPVSVFPELRSGLLSLSDWALFGKEIGLDAIDINVQCISVLDIQQLVNLRKELCRPVLMVTTYSDFSNPEREARQAAILKAKQDIEKASLLGARYIRLTAGQRYPDCSDVQTAEQIADCFESCICAAQNAGVSVLLENHSKPGAWQYDDYNFHMDRMCLLWEKMKHLPIKINYDTANAFAINGWKELIDMFGDRIETVHINDLESVSPLRFCCISEGVVPLEQQLQYLISNGFHGPFCIEEASMKGLPGIRHAVEKTKELLSRIGEI